MALQLLYRFHLGFGATLQVRLLDSLLFPLRILVNLQKRIQLILLTLKISDDLGLSG